MEEIDCTNFFDEFLDFPEDKNDIEDLLGEKGDMFTSFWPNPDDILPCSEPGFSDNASAAHLSAELDVPYEEIVHLEWLSTFVEDSFSGGSTGLENQETYSNKNSSSAQFRTPSPVSVLESSSFCTGGKLRPLSPETPTNKRLGRARSKRPRPATFTPRPAIQQLMVTPATSFTDSSESSRPIKKVKIPKPDSDKPNKKKKIKLILPSSSGDMETNQNPPSHLVRKCLHCEITKTPQWRAGPMGPKTLCNACGVRHKSGRLFPEYRPAASPTFVPLVHSNSHKKVVEMRSKGCNGKETMVMNKPEMISDRTENETR